MANTAPFKPQYWDWCLEQELRRLGHPRIVSFIYHSQRPAIQKFTGVVAKTENPDQAGIKQVVLEIAAKISEDADAAGARLLLEEGRVVIKPLGSCGTLDPDNFMATVAAKVYGLVDSAPPGPVVEVR